MKEELKVGDKVYWRTRWSRFISEIERETKTLWVTENGTKIYKEDNRLVGEYYYKAEIAKKEHYDYFKRQGVLASLKEVNFKKYSLEQLSKITDFLKEMES